MNKNRKETETKVMGRFSLNIYLLVLLPFYLFTFLPSNAQGRKFLHYDCMGAASPSGERLEGAAARRFLPLKTEWDSTRVYPIAVVLMSFSDQNFSEEHSWDFYNRIFNEEGYNEGKGPGCVTDYFRQQSSGLFNPRFDIFGPVKVSGGCKSYGIYGSTAFREALRLASDSLGVDFSPYDWEGKGYAETIIFIYAGYSGNEAKEVSKGSIWPHSNSMASITLNGVTLSYYSASAEKWSNDHSCGIGTICHEYSHTLGLPDLYPTSGDEYSVVDEWDLMDGGNFVNNGWCPPNYSAFEKMQLKWFEPEELSAPSTIKEMRTLAEGGKAYIIRTDNANEFFILENRQWSGWDLRTPGHGLLISHVDYNRSAWSSNSVNTQKNHHRYDLVHADNLDYNAWEAIIGNGSTRVGGHSLFLSGTAYPFVNDSVDNHELTDTSVPAATIYSGTGLLSKPITAITENEDATVSFLFMGGDPTDIIELREENPDRTSVCYDLTGRPISTGTSYKGLVIKNRKKYIIR